MMGFETATGDAAAGAGNTRRIARSGALPAFRSRCPGQGELDAALRHLGRKHPGSPAAHLQHARYEAWSAYVDEVYRAAPLKTARVKVTEKVPAATLEEVARLRAGSPSNQLPDRMLWLYFIWTTDGIKVRWKVNRATDIKQHSEGGDRL